MFYYWFKSNCLAIHLFFGRHTKLISEGFQLVKVGLVLSLVFNLWQSQNQPLIPLRNWRADRSRKKKMKNKEREMFHFFFETFEYPNRGGQVIDPSCSLIFICICTRTTTKKNVSANIHDGETSDWPSGQLQRLGRRGPSRTQSSYWGHVGAIPSNPRWAGVRRSSWIYVSIKVVRI